MIGHDAGPAVAAAGCSAPAVVVLKEGNRGVPSHVAVVFVSLLPALASLSFLLYRPDRYGHHHRLCLDSMFGFQAGVSS